MQKTELWKTTGVKLEIHEGQEPIVFERDHTLEEIKQIIEYNLILCGKASCIETCHYYRENKPNVEGNPCTLMTQVMNNFIETTSNFVHRDNSSHVENYLKALLSIMQFIKLSEEWKGHLCSSWSNWFYKSYHPRIHELYAVQSLEVISKFTRSNSYLKKEIEKEFIIFVEGDSEEKFLTGHPDDNLFRPSFIEKMGLYEIKSSRVKNVHGKDKLPQVKLLLQDNPSRKDDCFFIFDNDEYIINYRDELVREGLIEKDHFIIWDKEFEDAFQSELIYKSTARVLHEELPFKFDELKNELSQGKKIIKSMKKLYREKTGKDLDYDSIKTKVIIEVAKELSKDSEGELMSKLKKLDATIEFKSNSYYYANPENALQDG